MTKRIESAAVLARLGAQRPITAARGRNLVRAAALLSGCLVLASCHGRLTDYDSAGGATKKDYESLLTRKAMNDKAKPAEEPPIPAFQSVLAAPSAPELADVRRVSIAVTETVPVRDILIELARKANVDIELDQRIAGGIIMTATDRPFIEVVDRICEMAELRYKFNKNTLQVEIDDPVMQQYHLDVLNLSRTSSSEVASSTDASSASQAIGASGGGGGGGNKSSTSVSQSSKADFWSSVATNVSNILKGIQARHPTQVEGLKAAFVPQAAESAKPAAASAAATGPGAGAVNAARGLAARQDQVSQILAQDPSSASSAASDTTKVAASSSPATGTSEFSINPEAGIITVFATQRQHKAIERYLRDVLNSVSQQVLIEAKVLEVQLSDNYASGINWATALGPTSEKLNLSSNFNRDVSATSGGAATISGSWLLARGARGCAVTITNPQGLCSHDLSAVASLINQFGTVRTLSSPRLTVTNNQVAMLKVATNQVFFQLTATTTDATPTTAAKTTVNSQIRTVPVGLIMSVQPVVDPVTRRISLSVRPSITRITSFVNDPGVALTIAQSATTNPTVQNVTSPVPIIETREMDSIINLDSGDTIVMGGLMQDSSTNKREGVPGLMDVPVLGSALGENVRNRGVTELVVFIRATLVTPRATIADEDIRLYKTFTPDPRPIAF